MGQTQALYIYVTDVNPSILVGILTVGPQAVPISVKCALSWAPAGPSKQAIFMKCNDCPSYIKITPYQEGPHVGATTQRHIHMLAEGSQ